MYFSLKDLCSRSCMQIKMFDEHPELKKKPSELMLKGSEYQESIARFLGDKLFGLEIGKCYETEDKDRIYLSNDIITNDNRIIEVKYLKDDIPVEEWFFNSSILQCAIYFSFLDEGDVMTTSKFYQDEGHDKQIYVVKNDIKYFLLFGTSLYEIKLLDPSNIREYILRKAHMCHTWDDARMWDNEHKHMEYKELSNCFTYSKVPIL